ncbi:hypothetical protein [Buchananella felis]
MDLVYFDKQDVRPERDWELEERVRAAAGVTCAQAVEGLVHLS